MFAMLKIIIFTIINSVFSEYLAGHIGNARYVYLAEPVYIYKVEQKVDVIGNVLGEDLDALLQRQMLLHNTHNKTIYHFKINKKFKGDEDEFITLSFFSDNDSKSCELSNNYNDHNDDVFWESNVGRSINVNFPATHLIHTCFEMGKNYLLIDPKVAKSKAYELISSPNDTWLKFIKEALKQ